MIVVDSNIVCYLVFPSEKNEIIEQLKLTVKEWIAPVLWKSEFLNVASLYYRKGLITWEAILVGYEDSNLLVDSFEIHSHYQLIAQLVKQANCSSYDCEFVALAKTMNTKLVTYDQQILKEFPTIAIKPEDYLAQL